MASMALGMNWNSADYWHEQCPSEFQWPVKRLPMIYVRLLPLNENGIMISDNNPTLTVVASSFPPQVSGSTILLANLLSSYSGKLNAIVGYSRYSRSDPAFLAPCACRYLRLPSTFPVLYDRLSRRFPVAVSLSIRNSIHRALKEFGSKVVLATFPYDVNLLASFLAARQLNLPFYAHMHDLWTENVPSGTASACFAEKWEPVILKQSTRVLCMTEAMQKHYEKKYRIRTELLPHSIPEEDYSNAPAEMLPPRLPRPTVAFVGGVSSLMNLDALKVLASASELLPPDYELVFCTSMDANNLGRLGIRSPRLKVKYLSRADVRRLQSEAHVLVAPLSHKNCSNDEVRTVFSTKLLEYLVSGRPIIVFAPEGSYHADAAAKNGWGYSVTEDSPVALAAAIEKVVRDKILAARLVQGALREARSRSARRHARRLLEWVLSDAGDHSNKASAKMKLAVSKV
jgi:glycosyltransferase involved in cell wall biosynthesis